MLGCEVLNDAQIPPLPIPTPTRTWFRNNDQIYSTTLGNPPADDAMEFLMNNTILMLGVVDPQAFTLVVDGSITFQTNVDNITLPNVIPDIESNEEAAEMLFQLLLGTWTCTASNNLGTATIMYTIRECGE